MNLLPCFLTFCKNRGVFLSSHSIQYIQKGNPVWRPTSSGPPGDRRCSALVQHSDASQEEVVQESGDAAPDTKVEQIVTVVVSVLNDSLSLDHTPLLLSFLEGGQLTSHDALGHLHRSL